MSGLATLITAGSYVAGLGFAVAAIAKFKAHKDNPSQVPISAPICILFVSVALIFAPAVFKSVGGTLYGGDTDISGVDMLTDITPVLRSAKAAGLTSESSRGRPVPVITARWRQRTALPGSGSRGSGDAGR
jgi:hypothetical protein